MGLTLASRAPPPPPPTPGARDALFLNSYRALIAGAPGRQFREIIRGAVVSGSATGLAGVGQPRRAPRTFFRAKAPDDDCPERNSLILSFLASANEDAG